MDMRKKIVGHALLNACLMAVYIALIASLLVYMPKYVGDQTNTVLMQIVMLSLFVFSAVIAGILVVGKPILWYLDNRKSEALLLLGYTLALLFGIIIVSSVLLNRFSNSSAPVDSSWLTATSTVATVRYPQAFSSEYVSPVAWPPKVQLVSEVYACDTLSASKAEHIIVSGHDYCKTIMKGAAAGSAYTEYSYSFKQGAQTAVLSFTLRFPQCMNYDEPRAMECKTAQKSFDADSLADTIAQAVIFQ